MILARVISPALSSVLLLTLAGCATTPVAGTSITLDAVRAFVVAESGYDAAVETADLAAKSGALKAATAARIKALVDTGSTYVAAGRAAVKAANEQDLASETATLTTLAAQLAALSKG